MRQVHAAGAATEHGCAPRPSRPVHHPQRLLSGPGGKDSFVRPKVTQPWGPRLLRSTALACGRTSPASQCSMERAPRTGPVVWATPREQAVHSGSMSVN